MTESQRVRERREKRVRFEKTANVEWRFDKKFKNFPNSLELRRGGSTEKERILKNGDEVSSSDEDFGGER